MKTEVDEFMHQETVLEITLSFLHILVFMCAKLSDLAYLL